MLRNVCDSCNEVIDGEPVSSDDPEAVLLIDGEVFAMYENLCDKCKANLKAAVSRFGDAVPAMPSAKAKDTPQPEPPSENVAENVDDGAGRHPSTKEVRELPEQVVRQFPVKLRTST